MAIGRFLRRAGQLLWRSITVLRIALANLLFIGLLVLILAALFSERGAPIPDRAVLVVDDLGQVVEQTRAVDPLQRVLADDAQWRETALRDIVEAIDRAAADPRIEMLLLRPDSALGVGMSKSHEIGSALERFRNSGKPVVAAADWLEQSQFLLASFADEIWLNPAGDLYLEGFGVFREYFAEALDKLHIDMHVFRAGSVKDAAESLTRNDMSDAARAATRVWLDDAWQSYRQTVSEQRQLLPEAVEHYIEDMVRIIEENEGDGALAARQYGLVDELMTREEMRAALRERFGGLEEDEDLPAVGFRRYLAAQRQGPRAPVAERIGLVVAQGSILPGEQPRGLTGADSLAQQLRRAKNDERIRAVVLRVDSPGGVMFAGEVIRHALLDLKAAGKPVVASMGSQAASGGYQIVAAADEIWAQETTITGSIGVVLQFPTVDRALEELGIHNDGVGTTELAGGLNPVRPLAPAVARRFELTTEQAYRQFLDIVADGRGMNVEQVRRAADGQVWTGRQALDLGLVDRLGELRDAVASAASLAGLDDYELVVLEKPLSFEERLLASLPLGLAASRLLPADWVRVVDRLAPAFTRAWELDPGVVYSLCEDCRAAP